MVVNKWDCVPERAAEDMEAYKADVKGQLRAVGWAAVVCTTARWVSWRRLQDSSDEAICRRCCLRLSVHFSSSDGQQVCVHTIIST
jgi:hypothetical protein